MASRILRIFLVFLSILIPVILARVFFARRWNEWFAKKENSYFSMGVPITLQGWILAFILITIIVIFLFIINIYL